LFQFSAWVDAVIFVFSLENEASFNAIYAYYTKMAHYRNVENVPIILVGTQGKALARLHLYLYANLIKIVLYFIDAISDRCPRIIDDSRGRKLANDLKRCLYFETCATYGLNVERVFQEACQKIVQTRLTIPALTPTNSRPTTPTTRLGITALHSTSTYNQPPNMSPTSGANGFMSPAFNMNNLSPSHLQFNPLLPHHRQQSLSATTNHHADMDNNSSPLTKYSSTPQCSMMLGGENNNTKMSQYGQMMPPPSLENLQLLNIVPSSKEKEASTPTSTPTTSRKSRRRSNLFISSKKEEKSKNSETDKLGSGRSIPLKQGYLYKRSSKSLNKEWKKKYVTLCDDGRLTYHCSLHDYMDNVNGKEIPLQYVTVKVPGQKPRGSKSIITNSALTKKNGKSNVNNNESLISESFGALSLLKDKSDKNFLAPFESKELGKTSSQSGDESSGIALSVSNSQNLGDTSNALKIDSQTPNVKKRHRRMKSSSLKNNDVEGMYEDNLISENDY
jgi:Arf-GAP/GTPase/ANK repeat/PH domain-containing protein 1/3